MLGDDKRSKMWVPEMTGEIMVVSQRSARLPWVLAPCDGTGHGVL